MNHNEKTFLKQNLRALRALRGEKNYLDHEGHDEHEGTNAKFD